VLWYRIVDAAKSVIEVTDASAAVYQLALTGLRNIIGQHDLDEVLQERNKINSLLCESIVNSTMAWGLEVQRFEMKDVELPEAMQQTSTYSSVTQTAPLKKPKQHHSIWKFSFANRK
jgi:regulator of protease activity HflC (stomatin/prohibitin superfamily)